MPRGLLLPGIRNEACQDDKEAMRLLNAKLDRRRIACKFETSKTCYTPISSIIPWLHDCTTSEIGVLMLQPPKLQLILGQSALKVPSAWKMWFPEPGTGSATPHT